MAAEEAGDIDIEIVDAPEDAQDDRLSVWITDDLLVATVDAATLREVAGTVAGEVNEFVGTEFHTALTDTYAAGAQFLGAVDLARVMASARAEDERLRALGIDNAQHLIVERRQSEAGATMSAKLSFDGERSGLMSWLDAPGPMGALEFFSPDSIFASAVVVRSPADLFDEMLATAERLSGAPVEPDIPLDIDLRNDFLAALGGEFGVGVDGPALPEPAWKVVLEVYDTSRLQYAIDQLVAHINDMSAEERDGHQIVLTEETIGGHMGYEISVQQDGLQVDDVSAHYVYVDGYLIAAPSAVLVERAVQYYQSGSSLVVSPTFRDLLPQDTYLDFSAVAYSRVSQVVSEVLGGFAGAALTDEQVQVIEQMGNEGPSLYGVYGEFDRLRFVMNGDATWPISSLPQILGVLSLMQQPDEQGDGSENSTEPAAADSEHPAEALIEA